MWEKEKPREIVIVGSGIGGIYTAAGVSKYGVKPIIFEKAGVIGGRTASYQVGSFWCDHCPHMQFKMAPPLPPSEVLVNIRDAYGVEHVPQRECKGTTSMGFYYKGKLYPMGKVFPMAKEYDRNFTKKVYSYLSDDDLEKIEHICKQALVECDRVLTADVMTTYAYPDISKLPPGSVNDWLSKYTDREEIYNYFSSIIRQYTQIAEGRDENMKQGVYSTLFVAIMLCAGVMRFCYTYHPRYGGDAALIMPVVNAIKARGGEVKTSTPVKRIVIENGKVTGVVVVEDDEEKFVKSDIVVVDVRPRLALKEGLITEKELKAWDPETLESIKDIEKEQSWEGASLVWNVGLSKRITEEEGDISFMDEEGRGVGMFLTKPTSAPPGMQEMCFWRAFPKKELYPNGKLNYDVALEAIMTLKDHTREVWGKTFEESIVFQEVHTFNETDGAYPAFSPECKLAPWKSPIEGLYWAGDEAKPGGAALYVRSIASLYISRDITKEKICELY